MWYCVGGWGRGMAMGAQYIWLYNESVFKHSATAHTAYGFLCSLDWWLSHYDHNSQVSPDFSSPHLSSSSLSVYSGLLLTLMAPQGPCFWALGPTGSQVIVSSNCPQREGYKACSLLNYCVNLLPTGCCSCH